MTLACMTRFQVEERDTALDAAQGVLDFEERLWDNSRARLEAELLGALPPPGSGLKHSQLAQQASRGSRNDEMIKP